MLVDLPVSVVSSWEPLLAITGSREAYDLAHDQADEGSIVQFLVAEAANPGSVAPRGSGLYIHTSDQPNQQPIILRWTARRPMRINQRGDSGTQ